MDALRMTNPRSSQWRKNSPARTDRVTTLHERSDCECSNQQLVAVQLKEIIMKGISKILAALLGLAVFGAGAMAYANEGSDEESGPVPFVMDNSLPTAEEAAPFPIDYTRGQQGD
jgi:hypothetical protein